MIAAYFNRLQLFISLLVVLSGVFVPYLVEAATLSTSPATGVYALGSTFTVRVTVNSSGQAINAAEGTLQFNPRELSVVRVDRANSVFNLWVTEPSFSNTAGTISFSGGSPTGYSGAAGTVFSVTFKTLTAGPARISYANGSVLANDGRGTNVLSSMNGGTYTIEAASTQPAPEVVIEYVAPANTPAAPVITSPTHPNSAQWYSLDEAVINWDIPAGIQAIRTLFDKNQNSIPTKVYEPPIKTLTLKDLEEGVSYVHVQFKNAEGWGKVSRYRIGVDTIDPIDFDVSLASTSDLTNPEQVLVATYGQDEEGSPITQYRVSIDGAEPVEILDESESRTLRLPPLSPGYHTVSIEAIDTAGNSSLDTLAFTIEAFEPPVFTDYPSELNAGVIPVLKGMTRPHAVVTITVTSSVGAVQEIATKADETGAFTFIPEAPFTEGVYRISASAKDTFGAQSDPAAEIRIAVQKPGYLRLGIWLVDALSVIVPLVGLVILLIFSLLWLQGQARRLRGKVVFESHEALVILEREFDALEETITAEQENLKETKRTKKLSPAEEKLFEALGQSVATMRQRVTKEVRDVEAIVVTKD